MKRASVLSVLLFGLLSWKAFSLTDGELVPANEAQAIAEVTKLISDQVSLEAQKNGHAFRDAHRKAHGCVRAQFSVVDNLPASLKFGLFAEASNKSAWVRFSNGSGQAQDDHDGDGRGMAVKVLGVSGERNLSDADDEATSQDFLMINHPVFFVRNAMDYVGFQKAAASGNVLWWLLNPVRVFHEGWIAKAIQGKKMTNPLESTYFSMVPSKLGPGQIKFRTMPCPGSKLLNPSDSADRLRENLEATLVSGDACFLFQVQPRSNARTMPIEDATIEWEEEESAFVTVAKITIAQQVPVQGEACEVLSFNPWNGLKEHRPLGGISRARKQVYQTISRLRHDFNQQIRQEPQAVVAPPADVVARIEKSFDPKLSAVSVDAGTGSKGCALKNVRLDVFDPVTHDQASVQTRVYAANPKAARQAGAASVILLPPTGGENVLDRWYADALCESGIQVVLVQTWSHQTETRLEMQMHDDGAYRSLAAIRHVLDFLNPARGTQVGILGTSVGALSSALALGYDSRLNTAVLIVGGFGQAEIIARSTEQGASRLREERMKAYGYASIEDYVAAMKKAVRVDPADFVNFSGPKKVLAFVGSEDVTVPIANQRELVKKFAAESVEFAGDHLATIKNTAFTQTARIVEFFNKNLQ